ncbi:unnamed protein product [Rhodiola kirilowii]
MDSKTVLAAGVDSSGGRVTSPSGFGIVPTLTSAPSFRIRASPSFDYDDESESESDSEFGNYDFDESSRVVDVSGRKELSGSSSFKISSSFGSSSSSEEEEEEGGFLSGEEEFIAALERPYVAAEEVAFVEPSLRPIAKVSEDDDIEVSGSESGEDADAASFVEGNRTESNSVVVRGGDELEADGGENAGEATLERGIDNDFDDVLKVPETSFPGVDNAEEVPIAVVKPVGEGFLEADGVKFTTGGDSVVGSINVDVNVAHPGVAVVNNVSPANVASSGFEKPEEDSLAAKVEERGIDEEFDVRQVEDDIIDLTPSNDDLNVADEVEGKDVTLDRNSTGEDSLRFDNLKEDEVPLVSGEGDFVNVDENNRSEIKGEEVGINGRSTEVEEDKVHVPKPEDDVPMENGVKLTTEGDSVVEAIHLNISEPGVVVVKDSEEGKKAEIEVEESIVCQVAELNNGLDQTSALDEVSNADDDEKLETGTDQDVKQEEVNEVDQSVNAYAASFTKDLDQEESANDEIKHFLEEAHDMEGSASDDETDGMIFGSSKASKQILEELEQRSLGSSHSGAESSRDRSQMIDGEIVTDSEDEVDTDEEGSGKELFDSAALAALLKAAAGRDSDGNVTLSSQDVSDLFSAKRPAGLVSSISPRIAPQQVQPNLFSSSGIAARAESDSNLSEEERKKLESIQLLRVKFLRLVHRLGQSPEDSIAAQVLYRLVLVSGRRQAFSLDAAKRTARELESQDEDNLNFSINILVIGKSGVGKSATINSIFGENKTGINAFEPATTSVKEITGLVNGVHIRVYDTPGLKTSIMDQGENRKILASVKKATKKCAPDIVLYVDRLDSQTRDLNDLPLLRAITSCLGASIWRSAIVTLTHAASAPPDGPSGAPLTYEVFVAQRSHAVQQAIGLAVGDLRLMNPSMMNPVSLVENHPSCDENKDGHKVLPNGQAWRPQLLMFCYSMKILSEASALYKQQDPFDHQKLFGFRMRTPPLPYLLSSLLQSRTHPKLSADQGGDDNDSDMDLDDLSESEGYEEEDEYDQLPPFKPLRKSQLAKLNKDQLKAYYEEYDYRVKLLQKKQLREELKRMKEMKKGNVPETEFIGNEADHEDGAPASVPVPFPDMVLPPSFDCDNPAYRYRFLEPSAQFLARPVLDSHGWDHDCGYDGVNVEQSLAVASRFPAAITVQLTKDKKYFNLHLDSSIAAKHGENASTMAGFDIQNIGKKLAYIIRGETKFKNFKKNKTAAGFSVTFLGENIATGVKLEDQIPIGKRFLLMGSTGTVRSQGDAAYGANLEIKLRDADFPIIQDESSLGLSLVKWRGDLALGANLQAQFSIGRGSKVAVRLGLNNKSSGQITIRTSTSDQLQIALVGIVPLLIGIYSSLMSGVSDNYGSY